jgi:DNA-binding NarL/FixJ family response regulator
MGKNTTRKTIAVAVVEDDAGLRQSLRKILEDGPGTRCLAVVGSAEEAYDTLAAQKPDVILMDVNLPGASGVQCVERLVPLLPQTHFIMLTVFDDTEVVFQSLAAGAIGYLTKPVTPERLLEAIRDVCEGGAPMTSSIARRIVQAFRKPAADPRVAVEEILAPREQEVLRLLAKGYLQKEISDQLGISFPTVRTLTARIYTKLHVHSRSQAVAKYLGEKG